MEEKRKPINDEIKAHKVQLINEEGEFLWDMSLNDAKIKSSELWLDLMEITKKEGYSIVKVLDYWKYLYRQKKQEQRNKQKWKAPDIKTVRITFKISEHDLEVKKNQAEKFAIWWHPLKLTLMLKWRENHYENIAREKIELFVNMISPFYKMDWNIKKMWSTFIMMFKSTK